MRHVPISRKLLNDDESVVLSTRTHAKALIVPLVVLAVLAAAAGTLSTFTAPAGRAQPLLVAVVWAVAALLALRWVVKPFLTWLTTSYTVTDQRIITRSGILSRRGHDIQLDRVSDVAHERSLTDRLLGCGTLLVSVAGEHRVEWHDIPHVERVHLMIQDLLYGDAETRMLPQPSRETDGRG